MPTRHVQRMDHLEGSGEVTGACDDSVWCGNYRVVEEFFMKQPIPPYLFAFVVGELGFREMGLCIQVSRRRFKCTWKMDPFGNGKTKKGLLILSSGYRGFRLRWILLMDFSTIHYFTKPAYVHVDIRSSNILTGQQPKSKESKFQSCKSFCIGGNKQECHDKGIRVQSGVQYIETETVTPKLDMVLLELVTGKDAAAVLEGIEILLSAEISATVRDDAEEELDNYVKQYVENGGGMDQAVQFVKLSLSCLIEDPANRPSMDYVVSTLRRIQINVQKSDKKCMNLL
ncbi:hypothetical protein ACH5RR_035093 [Cinchona calisaya]|uniref:Uncharacterized protein n=1 Tax=Cinchona calisaya TaxID=153742 RepID=A0ABD2YFV2_9GENT